MHRSVEARFQGSTHRLATFPWRRRRPTFSANAPPAPTASPASRAPSCAARSPPSPRDLRAIGSNPRSARPRPFRVVVLLADFRLLPPVSLPSIYSEVRRFPPRPVPSAPSPIPTSDLPTKDPAPSTTSHRIAPHSSFRLQRPPCRRDPLRLAPLLLLQLFLLLLPPPHSRESRK